ncbi:THAP domain-containing protein 11 isoform X1 [Zerene cesonia]|uniref:THAP domain-containing protein 11 isoform X1 n=1 Tax=Zerene cesonia TaxID=33412 RepID=UPI0018E529E9|nr:THAP domain-containing protein 11 isoform X1 [Zerene cesonia]
MVNTSCAVFQCNSSSHRHKGLRFHQFPRDERTHLWVLACKRPDLIGKDIDQLKNMHVCSLHFEHRMYGKLLLKKSAVPTLNLPALATRTVSTQTDNPDAHMALHILTSQGVQTDEIIDRRNNYFGKEAQGMTVNQFVKACDVFLPRSLGAFVKSHIYLSEQKHG